MNLRLFDMKSATLVLMLALFSLFAEAQIKELSAEEVSNWDIYGIGTCKVDHRQIYIKEFDNSVGVTLVSPQQYSGDIILRYKLMPLNAATVCVAILNAHNNGDGSISYPKKYNGYVQFWTQDVNSYFFAFHNEAHNWLPFVQKASYEKASSEKLQIAKNYGVVTGQYNDVEVGRSGRRLWLKINDKMVLDAEDRANYNKGHIAFRIRGTGLDCASCLIKNIEVINN